MKNVIQSVLFAAALLALANPVLADTVSISGTIDGSEPTFDQPISSATIFTSYDTYEFTVDADGMYSFLSFYAGDPALDANLDGTLFLYAAFDPLNPAGSLASNDDYNAGELASLAAYDSACAGQNCSGFEAALTAGVTYVLVQSTFTDSPSDFGQPTGSYDITISGPGAISAIPVPAAMWLMLSALAGFGALRRR